MAGGVKALRGRMARFTHTSTHALCGIQAVVMRRTGKSTLRVSRRYCGSTFPCCAVLTRAEQRTHLLPLRSASFVWRFCSTLWWKDPVCKHIARLTTCCVAGAQLLRYMAAY